MESANGSYVLLIEYIFWLIYERTQASLRPIVNGLQAYYHPVNAETASRLRRLAEIE